MNEQLCITNTHFDKHVLRSATESSGAFLSSTDPENNIKIYVSSTGITKPVASTIGITKRKETNSFLRNFSK
jgi:hypothetical protein